MFQIPFKNQKTISPNGCQFLAVTNLYTEERMEGWMEGRMEGWTEGEMNDGMEYGPMDLWTNERVDGQAKAGDNGCPKMDLVQLFNEEKAFSGHLLQ